MIAVNMMNPDPATLSQGDTLLEALKLFGGGGAEVAAVLDGENRVTGIIDTASVIEFLLGPRSASGGRSSGSSVPPEPARLSAVKAGEFANTDFALVTPESPAAEVAALLCGENNDRTAVLVVDDCCRLLGVITRQDLVKRLWLYSQKTAP